MSTEGIRLNNNRSRAVSVSQSTESAATSAYLNSRTKDIFDRGLALGLFVPALVTEMGVGLYLSKVLNKGSKFYEELRIGGPEGYLMRKLRTMDDINGEVEMDPNDLLTLNNPRIPTKGVGRVRRMRLDELPQIRAIARGYQSFVGIRAISPQFHELGRQELGLRDRLAWDKLLFSGEVPVGATSWATTEILRQQANTPSEYFPLRAEYDLRYKREASLGRDIKIIVESIGQAAAAMARGTTRETALANTNSLFEPLEPQFDASQPLDN